MKSSDPKPQSGVFGINTLMTKETGFGLNEKYTQKGMLGFIFSLNQFRQKDYLAAPPVLW